MKQPSQLIVLLVLCSTALRSCVAVRFETLEELLKYHEQQQNPQQDEEETEPVTDGLITVTTPRTTQKPTTTQHQKNRQSHFAEFAPSEGSGLGFDDSTTAQTTVMSTTTLFQTEESTTTRRMTTCCHLGEQAGRKRHHCNPENYMPTMFRHRNRGHNFKVTNKHPSQQKSQIDKCVSGVVRRLAEEFQICCEEAYKRMWQSERGNVDVDRTHVLEIPLDRD